MRAAAVSHKNSRHASAGEGNAFQMYYASDLISPLKAFSLFEKPSGGKRWEATLCWTNLGY
jgi:hypothetical protein